MNLTRIFVESLLSVISSQFNYIVLFEFCLYTVYFLLSLKFSKLGLVFLKCRSEQAILLSLVWGGLHASLSHSSSSLLELPALGGRSHHSPRTCDFSERGVTLSHISTSLNIFFPLLGVLTSPLYLGHTSTCPHLDDSSLPLESLFWHLWVGWCFFF